MRPFLLFSFSLIFAAGSCEAAWACPGCYRIYLPVEPVVIMLAIAVLFCLNYNLAGKKLHFIIDIGILLFAFLQIRLQEKTLSELFLLYLIFATLRFLWRKDAPYLRTPFLKRGQRLFLLGSLGILVTLWLSIVFVRAPFFYSEFSIKGSLKALGTGLENYSLVNQGRYPARLDELVPRYMAEIPPPYPPLYDAGTVSFYHSRYHLDFNYGYQVSADQQAYTITCSLPRNAYRTPLRYSSAEGIIEQ